MGRHALGAVLVAAVLLAGCTDTAGPPQVGQAQIDVDTPELRAVKAAAGVADCEPTGAEPVEGGLPEVTLPCLGGGPEVDVSGLRGPMVVNLWASWCKPCRRELPIYQEFHERYGDRVAVLGIDFQDVQPAAAMELVRESGVTYPQLADPQSALSFAGPLPNIQGLPGILLIDAEGRLVTFENEVPMLYREIKSLEELEGLVAEHLGVTL